MNKRNKQETRRNKILFAAAMFLTLAVTVLVSFIIARSLACRALSCLSFPPLANRKPTELYENTPDTYRASYSTSEGLIRVSAFRKVHTKESSDNLTKVTLMRLQGLFADAKSPYPGPLSDEITCDNKYKPRPKTIIAGKNQLTYFYGYLNNRLQYGTCIDNQVTHLGYNALLYCPSHASWYQVEIIVPKGQVKADQFYIDELSRLDCRNPLSLP